ncbi:MAG: hypothetical protein J1E85_00025 [Ruminococcus sp.]|nr:hypothetical protein [Ruminococcus sp.]
MKVTLEEKLLKIDESIENENATIKKSKEKIAKLKSKKKRLEQSIKQTKFDELTDVLKSFGINSVEEFNKFIDNYDNAKNENSDNTILQDQE